MAKRFQFITCVTAVLGLAFLFMACGSGSSGGGVTYDGSTDPAVADSTTAATLAEFSLGAVEAGFPLAGVFLAQPQEARPRTIAADPQPVKYNTTVTIQVPNDAVYYGSDYDSKYGTGTAEISGSMTLYLDSWISATADTWYVDYAQLDGSIVFNDFRAGEEPDITGTVTISDSVFYFSGEADFSISGGEFLDDPGLPIWDEVELTFDEITVSDEGDSWNLGEGDCYLDIEEDSVTLDIYSMTVGYDGSTYKLEDTEVYVEFDEIEPEPAAIPQAVTTEQTIIEFQGTKTNNGTFYHPELGVIYFSGELTEEDPPGDLVEGELNFYDAAGEGDSQFYIYFGFDSEYGKNGATVYELNLDTEEFSEIGYFIDGTFIPDPSAPPLG